MKISTNARIIKDFGSQLILNEQFKVVGVNLIFNNKILFKKIYHIPLMIRSQKEELMLINETISEFFKIKA